MGSPSAILTLGMGTWGETLIVTLGYGSEQLSATLVGQWARVIQCYSANQRIECKSANKRIECYSENERV